MPLNDVQRREIEVRFADRRIFVQIAAYRDADLPHTVHSALARASDPARLRFGICHQFDDRTAMLLAVDRDRPILSGPALRFHVDADGGEHRDPPGEARDGRRTAAQHDGPSAPAAR